MGAGLKPCYGGKVAAAIRVDKHDLVDKYGLGLAADNAKVSTPADITKEVERRRHKAKEAERKANAAKRKTVMKKPEPAKK